MDLLSPANPIGFTNPASPFYPGNMSDGSDGSSSGTTAETVAEPPLTKAQLELQEQDALGMQAVLLVFAVIVLGMLFHVVAQSAKAKRR